MQVHCCDSCGKLIKDENIRIVLNGFSVLQNEKNCEMPKGFSIKKPEEFCSFNCLSVWAEKNQKMLDDYMRILEKRSHI